MGTNSGRQLFQSKKKLPFAKQLEKWGISAIEAGFPAASPDSFEAVKQIAETLTKTSVTGLARAVKSDIDAAYDALKNAKYPQIHVFIATSPVHMQYKLKKTPDEGLLRQSRNMWLTLEVSLRLLNFHPEDATRTEKAFLLKAVQTAVDAGATYINIPDTVGYTTPSEYYETFKFLIENVTSDRDIIFSPHCHDDLGMATANTLAAIKGGAGRVEGTINGIGERAGNVALEEVAVALKIREDYYQATSDIVSRNLSQRLSSSHASQGFQYLKIRLLLVGTPLPMSQGFIRMVSSKILRPMKSSHQNWLGLRKLSATR